jgi:hypothetical protein
MEPTSPPRGQVQMIMTAIEGKVPGLVADMYSIQRDLDFARQCAAGYLQHGWGNPQHQPADPEQTLISTALWSAAVIAYRRAFAVGKGHLIPKSQRFDIKGLREQVLTPEQAAIDDQLRQMADQHVAHRVSDLEQMKFLVALTPPPLPREVAGLGTMMVHMIGPEAVVAEGLIEICDALLARINQELEPFLNARREQLNGPEHLDRLYVAAHNQNQNPTTGTDSA